MSRDAACAADVIVERRRAYGAAIAARNAADLEQFLHPDLVIIASTGALRIGREAVIANYVGNEFRDPRFVEYERLPDSIEIGACATVAVERGQWCARLRQDDGSIDGPGGLYQAGWVKLDEAWLIRSEAYVRLSSGHRRPAE